MLSHSGHLNKTAAWLTWPQIPLVVLYMAVFVSLFTLNQTFFRTPPLKYSHTALVVISITRSELKGTQLRVEGNGALPNTAITINGTVMGTSDASGLFKIQNDPFSSATCQITVSDGSSSATASLSGCTPTAPTSTPTPALVVATPTPLPAGPTPTPTPVPALALSTFSLSVTSVTGGTSLLGTVTLTALAPSSGTFVTLTSSNPAVAQVPVEGSVFVSPGFNLARFLITTTSVAANTTVTISASFGGVTKTALLTVNAGLINCGGGGPTKTEILSGPAINGVVPEGKAIADMTQFPCGGQTILTVQVKKVNLPDSTMLRVSLDFTPIGTITLSGGQGTLTANLGHFGVSNDEVRVSDPAGTVILIGPFFQ